MSLISRAKSTFPTVENKIVNITWCIVACICKDLHYLTFRGVCSWEQSSKILAGVWHDGVKALSVKRLEGKGVIFQEGIQIRSSLNIYKHRGQVDVGKTIGLSQDMGDCLYQPSTTHTLFIEVKALKIHRRLLRSSNLATVLLLTTYL